MKVLTHLSYDPDQVDYSVSTLPSMTEPDQAYTVEELLDRLQRGETLGGIPDYVDPSLNDELGYVDDLEDDLDYLDDPSLRKIDKITLANEELERRTSDSKSKQSGSIKSGRKNKSQSNNDSEASKETSESVVPDGGEGTSSIDD